jgi:hypothetical protein
VALLNGHATTLGLLARAGSAVVMLAEVPGQLRQERPVVTIPDRFGVFMPDRGIGLGDDHVE